jgi:hypothetical protein
VIDVPGEGDLASVMTMVLLPVGLDGSSDVMIFTLPEKSLRNTVPVISVPSRLVLSRSRARHSLSISTDLTTEIF